MRIFALMFFFLGVLAVASVKAQPSSTAATITWDKTTHDFGDVVQGEKVEHVFRFTNTGTDPLVITNIQVTCGCTTPKGWPRDPIGQDKKAEIVIQFNSTGKIGRQNKVVTIVSNALDGNSQISFTANVIEKPQ